MDLLEVANFYLLHDVIDECNKKLSEHIKSLEIEDLAEWSVKVSQLSIHDQLYESCREAILAKLSRIIKENKWECFGLEVRNQLLEDLECTEVWKGDLHHSLQILKRLCSLEMDNLLPDTIIKLNSDLESYFDSNEDFQKFILDQFESNISLQDPSDSSYDQFNDKLKNHLNSIETQDSVVSKMYSLLKGDGLDLDREFQWDKGRYEIEVLEENGVDWDNQEDKDNDHYWILLEFASLHGLENLTLHCYIRLYHIILHSFPPLLAQTINRASETPGGEELFKLGILVFVNSTVIWRWFSEPHVDPFFRLRTSNRRAIRDSWVEAFKSFNEKAIIGICDQVKSLEDSSHGAVTFRETIRSWCSSHSSNPEEASRKFEMVFGGGVGSASNNSNGGT